ncbi:helix-turn-helix domain-containing protein [Amedibacillus sp. YH-ame10]
MIDIYKVKMAPDYQKEIVENVRNRRKEMKLSQEGLSRKSGVSLGSIKRFENSGEISLFSLIKIGMALECQNDFSQLFQRKKYQSIQEVIDDQI